MKLSIPVLLTFLFLAAPANRAAAQDDLDAAKGSSGEKFSEVGGKGGVSGGSGEGVDASGGTGNREAMDLVNGESAKAKLDGTDVPAPGAAKGNALAKGVGAAKGAVYGAVAGGVIGGIVGIVGGPAGVLGGAAAGVKLGAMAGMAIGAGIGFLMAGKSSSPGAIESRQSQLDSVMKGM